MLRWKRPWLPTGIALVALLWAALVPTLTHALSASGVPVEVCTAAGLRGGGDPERDTDTDRRDDPCALCGVAVAKAPPPPPVSGLPPRLARADGPAAHPDAALPRAGAPRVSAQPRAPPHRA